MVGRIASILKRDWGIPPELCDLAIDCEKKAAEREEAIQGRSDRNTLKVLQAFREAGVRESHLIPSFGYGYFDAGREALDRAFALSFGAEDAMVRLQFVSGTHAIRCALFSVLRPGDEVLTVPDPPYDTLHPLFGLEAASGSLSEWGITVRGASPGDLLSGNVEIGSKTRALFIQRSKGYAWRDSLSVGMIGKISDRARRANPDIKVVVDNCYGEFVEETEPSGPAVDLVAGSLIKNPGGGLAPTGGYLAGTSEAVARAAPQVTSPGLGKEVGATLGIGRNFFAGLFLSPRFVGEAVRTSLFASALFHALGFDVLPGPDDERTDTIQAIRLGSRERVLAFARGIQSAGPLEQGTIPEEAPMAGYADAIVMAGGTFVQGGSLELSCDAPLREPFIVYLQGGLSSVHGKLGVLLAAKEVMKAPSRPR